MPDFAESHNTRGASGTTYSIWSLAESEQCDVTYKQKLTTDDWNAVDWGLGKCACIESISHNH